MSYIISLMAYEMLCVMYVCEGGKCVWQGREETEERERKSFFCMRYYADICEK